MQELYENLLIAIKKMASMYPGDKQRIEQPNGYTLSINKCSIVLYDTSMLNVCLGNGKEIISLYNHITHSIGSEINRNTIRSSVRKYVISSVDKNTRYSSMDKSEYFHLSMINGNIPTYEHIQFAFELRKLFQQKDREFKSITVHPKFIDLQKLKNTEILFC